jgi:2-oxo-4-hydroxy-4-carboxy-5-ureidoimidazoline decarboxylase
MPASHKGTMLLLEQFNRCSGEDAAAVLHQCLAIDRWASQLVGERPFPTLDALLTAANLAAPGFTEDELEGALSHHPRIGDRVAGTSTEAGHSRAEQAGVELTDTTLGALAAGNLAYEKKFGRVFLIRAAGRGAEEILEALNRRLQNTPEHESTVIEEQLREIAVGRLRGEIVA